MNHRDHRKILVIDGHTAFTGGVNLADEYINVKKRFGHWKDTGVRLKGEAVWNFTLMFLEMWNAYRKEDHRLEQFMPHVHHPEPFAGTGYVHPFGDSPLDNETVAENVYIGILSQAKHYCYIFTPYLIVDDEMKLAITLAAKRGVDVRIVTPGIPDKPLVFRLTRSNYVPLLKAGVKIYEYTPGFIHAKSYVCDDEYAVVGTINMDYRSLYLHFECGTFLYRNDAVLDLKTGRDGNDPGEPAGFHPGMPERTVRRSARCGASYSGTAVLRQKSAQWQVSLSSYFFTKSGVVRKNCLPVLQKRDKLKSDDEKNVTKGGTMRCFRQENGSSVITTVCAGFFQSRNSRG